MMSNDINKRLSIFYIGSDEKIIQDFLGTRSLFHFVHRPNPLKASEWFDENGPPDSIICEKELPGINGLDFQRIFVGEYDKNNQIPYIILASSNDPATTKQALKQNADDIYVKPVVPNLIYQRIKFLKRLKPQMNLIKKEVDEPRMHIYNTPLFKRGFDIFFASIVLLIASPLLLLVIIAIRLESKGKVYYISKRVGTGYRIFNFLKLRSMYPDADKRLKEFEYLNQYQNEKLEQNNSQPDKTREPKVPKEDTIGPVLFGDDLQVEERQHIEQQKTRQESAFVKFENDPRITKVGKIIRKMSIDELPKLINVIKGDMSIVGNRPLPLYEAELLTTDEWTDRFNGPAGITGLWQVEARGKSAKMSPEERKQLDNKYVKIAQSRFSFWKDIWIILRTIPAVFQKENV
jgi:lipopolysaccharide/colanic/teichoic acid biosynthesis glycosyltransferase